MIILTRLGVGLPVAVNPDLIERADCTPDTVITLVDGHKLVITESIDQVVDLVRKWRASVAAEAWAMSLAGLRGAVFAADDDTDGPAAGQNPPTELREHLAMESMAQVYRLPTRRED